MEKRMDFIQETQITTKETKPKEMRALFDKELFYCSEKNGYSNIDIPPAPSSKPIVYNKEINHPDTKEKIEIKGNFKTYAWIGFLLSGPIGIETVVYPERARKAGTETYINKNLYRVTIPEKIYTLDSKGNVQIKQLTEDSKFNVTLPDLYDVSKKNKAGDIVEYKDQKPQRLFNIVFPVVIMEDNLPKIVFFSQVINTTLKKTFQDLKITTNPSNKFIGEYLFSTILKGKPGDQVVFFNHPNLQYAKDKNAWSGWNWFSIYDKLEDIYKKQYFDFDWKKIKAQVSDEYLALLAARFTVGNLTDKKGNGKVYNEDKTVDEIKSSVNSLIQHNLSSLIYKELDKLTTNSEDTSNSEKDTLSYASTEEIPF
jgi:hypothetical protein